MSALALTRRVPGLPVRVARLLAAFRGGSRLALAVRVLVPVALLALASWQLDLRAALAMLRGVDVVPATAGVLTLAVGQIVSGLRWRAVAGRYGMRGPAGWFVRAYLRGCFYNAVLPTGIGGDATRIVLARRLTTARAATRSVLVDRVLGLAVLALTTMLLVPLTPYDLGVLGPLAAAAAAVLLVSTLVAAVVTDTPVGAVLGWSVLYEVVWFLGLWLLARALGLELPVAALPAVTLVVGVAVALPVSLGGTGAREAAFVLALAPLGIAATAGIALGVLWGVALALVGLLGAVVRLPAPVSVGTPAAVA